MLQISFAAFEVLLPLSLDGSPPAMRAGDPFPDRPGEFCLSRRLRHRAKHRRAGQPYRFDIITDPGAIYVSDFARRFAATRLAVSLTRAREWC